MTGRVLVVDDLDGNIRLARRLLDPDGHELTAATSGEDALAAVAARHPDVILLDVRMPGLDGFQICRRLKEDPATRLLPVVLVTASRQPDDKLQGFDAGADDFITKPFNPHELRARVRSLVRIKRYTDDLDSAASVILSLAQTIEARDPHTEGHCRRLSAYATVLGRHIGLEADDLEALDRGGVLHDIGKVGVPDAVLLKPGRLTPAEFETMKAHTVIGDGLCGELRALQRVRPIVRSHHERLDGSGYPDGLEGDAVPLLAQVMGIVDVYDALTTWRPYKAPLAPEVACEELAAEAARGWRRQDLVSAFRDLVAGGRLPSFDGGPQ